MVGKDKIEITAELKDLLTGQLKNIQNEAAKLDNTLKNLGDGGAIGGKAANTQRSMMGSVLGANLLSGAIGMATSAVKDFFASGFESMQKFENYEARMTTLLGSRKAAIISMKNIVQDASTTPFDVGSLTDANAALIGAGESAGGARKMVMNLGNAIAATGGTSVELQRMAVNLNQIRSLGKASALDVRQFVYAGIPIYKLLNETIHKNKEEVEKDGIAYNDLARAFELARKEGGMFYKGMETANNTMTGRLSALGDSWEQLKVSILKSQSGILGGTISWMNSMVSSMNRGIEASNLLDDALKHSGAQKYSFFEKYPIKFLGKAAMLLGMNPTNGGVAEMEQYASGMYQNLGKTSKDKLSATQNNSTLSNIIRGIYSDSSMSYVEKGRRAGILNEIRQMNLDLINSLDAKVDPGNPSKPPKDPSSLEKIAAANRPTQVNINIENLVREYSNTFNTAAEALKMTPEQVAKVLIGAVNDISNLKYT